MQTRKVLHRVTHLGRPWQYEIHLESGHGDNETVPSHFWRLQADCKGHRVRRQPHSKRMASKIKIPIFDFPVFNLLILVVLSLFLIGVIQI